jgi:uncharacterized membrane protein YdjX (TVP38/TMEM64 family)
MAEYTKPEDSKRASPMKYRLILLAAILAVAGFGYFSGLYQYLAPERLRLLLTEAGIWGPVVIILLFSILEPFGTPGVIFLLTAATLWPFPLAFLVNWLGATGAGMIGFAFARYLGRHWVEDRMPARLRLWNERLAGRGVTGVILFRLLFFLNPASHWALGLSKVPAPTAFFGTLIGFAPAIALWTYFGAEILVWFEAQSVGMWVAVVAGIVAFILFRNYRKRAAAAEQV